MRRACRTCIPLVTIMAATAESTPFGQGLGPAQLAKLQAWFSPAFPVGGFSYSHGLEWAVENEGVQDARALAQWVEGALRYGAGRCDAILLGLVWKAVRVQDWHEAAELRELAAALQPSAERRLESLHQGSAFLCAVEAGWPHPVLSQVRTHCPGELAYPVAIGAATAAHGLPLDAVLVAWLHAFCANLVSAGVRLVPLGQTDGLRILAALEPLFGPISRAAQAAGADDLGSACLLADIASMCHETQYTRLFRS